jgi:hypothetical protein
MDGLLTREMAQRAVKLVLPLILILMESGHVKRKALHVVITDPTKQPGFCNFGEATLYEESIGKDTPAWEHHFDDIAMRKARQAWRTGFSNRYTQAAPWLLFKNDTMFKGTAVSDDGSLIVAVSGVEDYYDEMFSKMILAAIQALSHKKFEAMQASGETVVI